MRENGVDDPLGVGLVWPYCGGLIKMEFDLKRALILTAIYLVPFLLIAGAPTNNPAQALLWFVYVAIAFILLGAVVLVGWKFFDLSFFPWGLIILISPILMVVLQIAIVPGLWYFPALVVFVVGLIGD